MPIVVSSEYKITAAALSPPMMSQAIFERAFGCSRIECRSDALYNSIYFIVYV